MSNLNRAMIIGRLGADPEVRSTQSGTKVATLSVATSEKYKDRNGSLVEKTGWHRITAWGRLAEICQQYLKKGSLAYFEGPIETKEYTDKQGNKRYSTQIKALSIQMLGGKTDSQGGEVKSEAKTAELPSNLDDLDDDLPFAWLLLIGSAGLLQSIINLNVI